MKTIKQKLFTILLALVLVLLPMQAHAAGIAEDGTYTVEASLQGGTGRVTIHSPVTLTVQNGSATAQILWSSSNYTYMEIDGVRYDAQESEEGSLFEIPLQSIDAPLAFSAETVAMSAPHVVEYSIEFLPETLKGEQSQGVVFFWVFLALAAACASMIIIKRVKTK